MRNRLFAKIVLAVLLLIPSQTFAQKEKWPSSIFICGGSSPQASIYLLGAAVSKMYGQYLGITASPVTAPGALGSLTRLAKKEIDIGYSTTTTYELIFPRDPVKQQKEFPILFKEKRNMRQIFATTSGVYHVIARTGINSLPDLKGKRFAYEAPSEMGKPQM